MNRSLKLHRWSLGRNSNRTVRADRRKHKPFLEVLENYYLMSAYTVTNANNSGSGSLRSQITAANGVGASTISFAIGSQGSTQTIDLTSPLPALVQPIAIIGSTQGGPNYVGGPLITLDGNEAGETAGIDLESGSSGSTIQGLSIVDFDYGGVLIGSSSTGNVIEGNGLGVYPNGDYGGNGDGIDVYSSGNTIGGPILADKNVIMANYGDGIYIDGTSSTPVSGNIIENNNVGVLLNNDYDGNGYDNIYADYTVGLQIVGNKIVDSYDGEGIEIRHSTNPTIGGTARWQGNIIEGNDYGGIFMEGVDGPSVIGNTIDDNSYFEYGGDYGGISCSSLSGSPAVFLNNTIDDNRGDGIYIADSYVNLTIEGNDIEANSGDGVSINTHYGTSLAISASIDGNQLVSNEYGGIFVGGGDITLSIQSNTIESSYGAGITIYDESYATIGGTTASEGNVIAGNEYGGILLGGSYEDVIQDNLIGVVGADCAFGPGVTGPTGNGVGIWVGESEFLEIVGNTVAENHEAGIVVEDSYDTLIGGSAIGAGNVIADNDGAGIFFGGVDGPTVAGNLIEYNDSCGVRASGVSYGGASFVDNTISANAKAGIYVFDSKGTIDIYDNSIESNSSSGIHIGANNTVDKFAANINDNAIDYNGADGIYVADGVVTLTIQYDEINWNLGNGVEIDYESHALIGGVNLDDGNLIQDNGGDGIVLLGTSITPSADDVIENNSIGGSQSASGNSGSGIWARYTANLQIKDNVIENNSDSGIAVSSARTTAASIYSNTISYNGAYGIFVAVGTVGVKIDQNTVDSNSNTGIAISSATQSATAVDASVHYNTINGNLGDGIYVSSGLVDVSTMGDTIGGNTGNGIDIFDEPGATIGGNCSGMGNTIETNGGDGIYLGADEPIAGAIVQNNTISSNDGDGVDLNSSGNTIGGTGSYEANTITSNTLSGVALGAGGDYTGNLISGNSIYGNGALGISLDSSGTPLPNGSGIENNNGQDYPVLSSVGVVTATGTTVSGTLDGTVGDTYNVQFFTTTTADPSGYGQGETYLSGDDATVTIGLDGQGTFNQLIGTAADYPVGTIVTATATDANGNTSEFSLDASALPTTSTSLVSSNTTSLYGQVVTLTATVSFIAPGDDTPTGTVTFYDGDTSLGTGTLNNSGVATLQTTALTLGMHTDTITAVYGGDANNLGSTSNAVSDTVTVASTQTVVTSSANPSVFGQSVTFYATVSAVGPAGGSPTGSVVFKNDGVAFGTVSNLGGGVWTVSTSSLAVASYPYITADFTSDSGNYLSSDSGDFAQTVNKSATHDNVISSASPTSVYGQTVTFTATVKPTVPGVGIPTGTVDFYDDSTNPRTMIGSEVLTMGDDGVISIQDSSLPVGGPYQIEVDYSGDGNFLGSDSPSSGPLGLAQTVNKAGTASTLTSSASPSAFGQNVTFTATVVASSPGAGTPTGSVSFYSGTMMLGTPQPLSVVDGADVATYSTAALTVGSHANITAIYTGDGNFLGNTSPTISQTVNQASTSTTVSSSSVDSTSDFGEMVTFTADVAVTGAGAGTPIGSVGFYDGPTLLGTEPLTLLDAGVTTFSTTALAVGTHSSITASYLGSTSFLGSTSVGITQTVDAATTQTLVSSSGTPSVYGQSVTFTATVSVTGAGSGTPTGTVNFLADGVSIGFGTPSLTAGEWTFSTSALAVQNAPHAITADYSGATNFASSNSVAFSQTVGQSQTLTTVTSSGTPSVFGQSVTLTATVAPTGFGSGTPTGTVTFYADGGRLGDGTPTSPGVWSLSTSTLAVGTYTQVAAVYNGDSNFNFSESTYITQTVNHAQSQTTVTSSVNSSVYGQPVTFTATVSPVAPGAGTSTGTVSFYDDYDDVSTLIGTGTPIGAGVWAVTTTGPLAVGTHPEITADYSGDANFDGSNSADLSQTVIQATSQTTVTSSGNPTVYTQSVTLTATVAAVAPGVGTPTGTVTFYNSGVSIGYGTPTITPGVWTIDTTSLSIGSHPAITAGYGGDANFKTSTSSPISQLVAQESSQTTVTSSINPSLVGQSITFTATVAAVAPGTGTPTGTVTIFNGGTPLGTATPSQTAGVWTFSTTALGNGTQANITAVYGGDGDFESSVSPTLTQTVNLAVSQATVTSSGNPSIYGQSVTLTATVAAVLPSTGTPTGSVVFFDGQTQLGTGTLVSPGVWTFATTGLAAGSHPSITAVYSGDADFQGNTSPAFSQTVNQASSQSTLAAYPNPSNGGALVTFTATVAAVSPNVGQPTGVVTFLDGSTVLGTGTLSRGVATFTDSSLAAGPHSITASYGGDGNFQTSTSPAVTQTVQATNTPAVGASAVSATPTPAPTVVTAAPVPVAPAEVNGPTVAFVQRYGSHKQATSLVISFNDGIDAASAQTLSNYSLVGPAGKHARGAHSIDIGSAVFNAAANSVTLTLSRPASVHANWTLTIDGTSPGGVRNTSGVLLDGEGDGVAGSNYVATITPKNLTNNAVSLPKALHAKVKALFHHVVHTAARKGR